MKILLPLILILFAAPCFGESYLCVSEAGAGVTNFNGSKFEANVYDMSEHKFILTNNSGKWLVKRLGVDSAMYDYCASKYFCESSSGYVSVFNYMANNTFHATWISSTTNSYEWLVASGRCSKL